MTNESAGIGPRSARLKRLRRLVTRRRARFTERAFVVEGPVLVGEAIASPLAVLAVYAEPDAPAEVLDAARAAGVEVVAVAAGALGSVLDTVAPRPVAAEVAWPGERTVADVLDSIDAARPVLVLAELADPGNVGTLLRTAEAAGYGAVVIAGTGDTPGGSDDTADGTADGAAAARGAIDPTNPKVVRAAAGALFRLPVASASWSEVVDAVAGSGRPLVATVVDTDAPAYDTVDLAAAALVLGSEAHGLSSTQVAACAEAVTIPLDGPTESLNVAAAGAILCFASAQQRRVRVPAPPS
ncbi:MAG: TrmH family RNA methyltransferase [Acidimicrobiales bacterium]